MAADSQIILDRQNAEFWNMICGSSLAKHLGIAEITPESLKRFDAAFFEIYPYLRKYIPLDEVRGKRVLEIGLGYGTLGQLLAEAGARYYGLDIAPAPCELMRFRLANVSPALPANIKVGSALACPFPDNDFDYVFSLGCFHHTGDTARCISEVCRVLKPGGRAVIMLYHRYSWRRMVEAPIEWLKYRLAGKYDRSRYPRFENVLNSMFDADGAGRGCPHVDFVSKREAMRLFRGFSACEVALENWLTPISLFGRFSLDREQCMRHLSRYFGHDVYIVAVK